MISLTLSQAVITYAAGLVTLLLLLSFGRTAFRLRREARSLRRRIQCSLCGTIYENLAANPLPICPNCSHPNEPAPPLGL